MKYKILLVERPVNCPNCDKVHNRGSILLLDDYRDKTICPFCREEYEKKIIEAEGEDGEFLK